MKCGHYLRGAQDVASAQTWAENCAAQAGWSSDEAQNLASTIGKSAQAVANRAYRRKEAQPLFLELDLDDAGAAVSMHHEGAVGDEPCNCEAAAVAVWRKSSIWSDAQVRTHALRLNRR